MPAAGHPQPQHAPAFGQKGSRLDSIEVLEHVRRIDGVHRAARMGNAARGVGVADAVGAAKLDKRQAVRVDQAEARQPPARGPERAIQTAGELS